MSYFAQRDVLPGVASLIFERWSPRKFEKTMIDDDQLARLIEAARWSPSCFNEQPWRFHTSSDATFDTFLDLLVEGNQGWARDAAVLGFVTTRLNFARNGNANDFAGFDAGAAWMSMTLQARHEGLYTHGMGGIRADAVAEYLNLDKAEEQVLMGFAIGKVADRGALTPEEQVAETPNTRKPLEEIWVTR